MKASFALLVGLHGLIHLMGFLKAFGWGKFPMLTEQFSRIHGLFWLLTTLLFLLTLTLYLLGQTTWPWIALGAVTLSQVLVIISWPDAKHGTWANAVILLVAVVAMAENQFNQRLKAEVSELFELQKAMEGTYAAAQVSENRPPVVEQWLSRSGVTDFPEIRTVYLRQRGEMRTKPDGKWMPFTAEQWFSVKHPGFVWKTRVDMAGPVFLTGRDKYISGEGAMDISLLSLIPVAKATGDPKIDQASGIRYLAEICWFPVAAREPYVVWERMGERSAKATFRSKPEITGLFNFDGDGDMVSFEAERYRGSGEEATLETWTVKNTSHAEFNGLRIPDQSQVYWATADGEFHWLTLEITKIHFK
jgi:hypothetical protein